MVLIYSYLTKYGSARPLRGALGASAGIVVGICCSSMRATAPIYPIVCGVVSAVTVMVSIAGPWPLISADIVSPKLKIRPDGGLCLLNIF